MWRFPPSPISRARFLLFMCAPHSSGTAQVTVTELARRGAGGHVADAPLSPTQHFCGVSHANYAQHIDAPVTGRSHRAAHCRSALTQPCSQNFLAPRGSARLEDNVEAKPSNRPGRCRSREERFKSSCQEMAFAANTPVDDSSCATLNGCVMVERAGHRGMS